MKPRIGRVEMIRDAKCARFLVPIRHLQLVIIILKQSKVEEIHINGNQVMIFKQKKWKLDKPALLQMGKKKGLDGWWTFILQSKLNYEN